MHFEGDVPMTDRAEIANELDRLVTQGHQDSSLPPALHRKFPDISQSEIEAALIEITAERRLKMKDRLGTDADPTS
jgi:hypothetical protein